MPDIWNDPDLWGSSDTPKAVTKEDVDAQRRADAQSADPDKFGQLFDLISGAVTHVLPDAVGFAGDVGADAVKFIKNFASQGMHGDVEKATKDLDVPGAGPTSKVAEKAHDKVFGHDLDPQTTAQRYAYSGARMGADSLVGGPRALVGGVTSGLAGEGANDLFPGNPYAQLFAMVAGGLTPEAAMLAARRAPEKLVGIIQRLEGGGTLEHPLTSRKGAVGPMQVMPDTARDPGFGIRPWDGKSQQDLARVGEDYATALDNHYGGDKQKVLAAYNAGPGHVDHLLEKYGNDWKAHLPDETKNYLANAGMLHEGAGGSTGGSVPPVDPAMLQRIMRDNDLNNLEASVPHLPETESKHLTEMENLDSQLERGEISWKDYDERLQEISNRNPNPPSAEIHYLNKPTEEPLELHKQGTPDLTDPYAPYRDMLDIEEIAKPVVDNTGYEKFTPYPEEKTPANDVEGPDRFASNDPHIDRLLQEGDEIRQAQHEISRRLNEGELTPEQADRLNAELSSQEYDRAKKIEFTTKGRISAGEIPENYLPVNERTGIVEKGLIRRLIEDEDGSLKLPDIFYKKKKVHESEPEIDPGEEIAGAPEQMSAVERAQAAIDRAKPLRKQQDTIYHDERARRLKNAKETRNKTSGEAGFFAEKAHLAGELPKVDFEGIRPHLSQEDIDHLHDMVSNHPRLGDWDKIHARDALQKVLGDATANDLEGSGGGKVPTPGEIHLLSQVFGDDFAKSLTKKLPLSERVKTTVLNALSVPRALRASFDLSAPLRQGINLIHTKEWWKAFGTMFKVVGSPKGFEALQNEIVSRPTWPLMHRAGLALTYADRYAPLTAREEQFASQWAEKIPGVQASERAYVGFLNKLRADTFDRLVKESYNAGIDFRENPKALKDIAKFVNNATGRGELPKAIQAWQPTLNATLFSPRLMASRVRMLTQVLRPETYLNMNPVVRKEYFKSMFAAGAIIATVVGLAKMNGAEVETDPASSDFLKIKIGDMRKDLWGGYQQYIKLAYSLASGRVKNVVNGNESSYNDPKFGQSTRKDALIQFISNKENPVAATVDDLLTWPKEKFGEKITPQRELKNLFLPMVMDDIRQAYQDSGQKGVLMTSDSVFGVGNQIIKPKAPKEKKGSNDPFSDPALWGNSKKEKDPFNNKELWGQ